MKRASLIALILIIAATVPISYFTFFHDPHHKLLYDPDLKSPEHYKAELKAATEAWHASTNINPNAESICEPWREFTTRFHNHQANAIQQRKAAQVPDRTKVLAWQSSYTPEWRYKHEWFAAQLTPDFDLDSFLQLEATQSLSDETLWLSDHEQWALLPLNQQTADETLESFNNNKVLEAMDRVAQSSPAWCEGLPPESTLDDSIHSPRFAIRDALILATRTSISNPEEAAKIISICANYTRTTEHWATGFVFEVSISSYRAAIAQAVENIAIQSPPSKAATRQLIQTLTQLFSQPFPPADLSANQTLYWTALDRREAGIDTPNEPGLATGPNTVRDIYRNAVQAAKPFDTPDRNGHSFARASGLKHLSVYDLDEFLPAQRIISWYNLRFYNQLKSEYQFPNTASINNTVNKLSSPYFSTTTLNELLALSSQESSIQNPMKYNQSVFFYRFARGPHHHLATQSSLRLATLYLAVRSHQAHLGSPPPTLSDLVPTYFTELPTDPLAPDGQFRYRVNPDNTFMLYSVGADQTDDGGLLPFHDGKIDRDSALYYNANNTAKGDYVIGPAHYKLIPPTGLDSDAPPPPGTMQAREHAQ